MANRIKEIDKPINVIVAALSILFTAVSYV